jgi:hypothetical protein
MKPTPSGKSNASRHRFRTDAFALAIASVVLFGVVLGSVTSCGDADLLIPGGGPIRPSLDPDDETPEATDTPDR